MLIQDAIVSAFASIPVQMSAGISGGVLQMELASVVLEARSRPKPNLMLTGAQDPILQSIETFLQEKRVHIAWEKLVILGCSAGGDVALRSIFKNVTVPHLPIIIAMHHNPGFKFMTKFQMKNGINQRVQVAKDGESIRANKIYFLEGDKVHNFRSATKSFSIMPNRQTPKFRPEIDVVMANAGTAFKSNIMGAILSGMLSDGAEGIKAMSLNGATTFIQEPSSAMFKDMPHAAQKNSPLSRTIALNALSEMICKISRDTLKYEKLGGFAFTPRTR